eukprot:CAMPEP_0172068218 /NCGR_PEP_ID=MMETSP1043-20130122/12100_1 /TAXON_ID=464988 /ORGANISM="Hemiselmis andersenii, Strain CCMP441" /LENGTH=148 /DNA_ID=CAMNT_0012728475 /DNA_START=52 /DNA_END=496 /DNA_ORIENTATION=+
MDPAPAPSTPASTAPGATTAELMPQKEPQKAAVAGERRREAEAGGEADDEDATTTPHPAECTSSQVATAAIDEATTRREAVRTTTPVPEAAILGGPASARFLAGTALPATNLLAATGRDASSPLLNAAMVGRDAQRAHAARPVVGARG